MRRAGIVLALLVAACASTPKTPVATATAPRPPGATPGVKIGNPYVVLGKTYYPSDDRSYDVTGIASWYGPTFHGLSTANGERYDQDGATAAHKTLPMPSFVEVVNLDNGRTLTVRINDRGPFVDGRIIDLSRKSAQLLGVDRPGTARVRVRRVFPDAPAVAALAPPPAVVAEPLPPAGAPADVPVATVAIPGAASGTVYVQVAALSDPGRAAWLGGFLATFGTVVSERSPTGLTRVRLGPYIDEATAIPVLARVQAAGYTDARLVTPKPGAP